MSFPSIQKCSVNKCSLNTNTNHNKHNKRPDSIYPIFKRISSAETWNCDTVMECLRIRNVSMPGIPGEKEEPLEERENHVRKILG